MYKSKASVPEWHWMVSFYNWSSSWSSLKDVNGHLLNVNTGEVAAAFNKSAEKVHLISAHRTCNRTTYWWQTKSDTTELTVHSDSHVPVAVTPGLKSPAPIWFIPFSRFQSQEAEGQRWTGTMLPWWPSWAHVARREDWCWLGERRGLSRSRCERDTKPNQQVNCTKRRPGCTLRALKSTVQSVMCRLGEKRNIFRFGACDTAKKGKRSTDTVTWQNTQLSYDRKGPLGVVVLFC